MSQIIIAVCVVIVCSGLGWALFFFLAKHLRVQKLQKAHQGLTVCQQIFDISDHIASTQMPRELRRGLVLIANQHLQHVEGVQPEHPLLPYMRSKLARLNKIPRHHFDTKPRNKNDRKLASARLTQLAGIIELAVNRGEIDDRDGNLARASAQVTARQVEVENARQASKDAENMQAFTQALKFAYHAQSLCTKLPPLIRETLTNAVEADIARLKEHAAKPTQIAV
ncbi:MAG: hypothetical protein AAF541_24335 [Pseudomonadota bacterium]